MLDAILVGATGRMGQAIAGLSEKEGIKIVASVGMGAEYENISDVMISADVIIDFSTPAILDDLLGYAINNKTPLFIGTTGHNEEQKAKIKMAGNEITICLASNTSVGINVLFEEARGLAKKLSDWDIEIEERHHNQKKDAPSGTALTLAHSIIQARPELEIVTDRSEGMQERGQNELGISAIRAGNIVGEHTVIYVKDDEIIEVTHKAYSRKIFAQGAITLVSKLASKSVGFYEPNDLL